MALIQEVQTDEWWQDVTVAMLEIVRRRLRGLVKFIEKQKRKPIYTDFEDEMGGETSVALPGFGEGADDTKFRAKAQAFQRAHQDHIAIHKLRSNKALTAADPSELERMLVESGVGAPEEVNRAKIESQGLGLFVRSLIGMDREAAKHALIRCRDRRLPLETRFEMSIPNAGRRATRPTHPGEMLREDFLPDYDLTVAGLAKALGVFRQTMNELLRERRAASPEMALRRRSATTCVHPVLR